MISPGTMMWILIGATLLLGVPFTLWWWKIADKWADAEHKRFKDKPDTRERVIVKPRDELPGGGAP